MKNSLRFRASVGKFLCLLCCLAMMVMLVPGSVYADRTGQNQLVENGGGGNNGNSNELYDSTGEIGTFVGNVEQIAGGVEGSLTSIILAVVPIALLGVVLTILFTKNDKKIQAAISVAGTIILCAIAVYVIRAGVINKIAESLFSNIL